MKLSRMKAALGGGLVATAMIASSCVTETPAPTKTFKATSVTVNNTNDDLNITCFCTKDEPKVINIGFRVKVGVANSAATVVAIGANQWNGVFDQGLAAGESHNYSGGQQAAVTFANISSPDVLNLAAGTPLEVVGYWAWKVEDDGILAANANAMANTIASVLNNALNTYVAAGQLPSDPNAIVQMVLDSIFQQGFLSLIGTGLGALLNNLNILSDDVLGSAMYIGVGSSGSLAGIINGVASGIQFPSVAIPTLEVPPDIGGGAIFSTEGARTFVDGSTNVGVDGKHTTTYTFG
ncbi:MAG: hypothetical protein GX868_17155 [Actinobacteria bacterium]|nr:hypothetical protein [Actinomycetota bacterium]